jgi:hypothetical protein
VATWRYVSPVVLSLPETSKDGRSWKVRDKSLGYPAGQS